MWARSRRRSSARWRRSARRQDRRVGTPWSLRRPLPETFAACHAPAEEFHTRAWPLLGYVLETGWPLNGFYGGGSQCAAQIAARAGQLAGGHRARDLPESVVAGLGRDGAGSAEDAGYRAAAPIQCPVATPKRSNSTSAPGRWREPCSIPPGFECRSPWRPSDCRSNRRPRRETGWNRSCPISDQSCNRRSAPLPRQFCRTRCSRRRCPRPCPVAMRRPRHSTAAPGRSPELCSATARFWMPVTVAAVRRAAHIAPGTGKLA